MPKVTRYTLIASALLSSAAIVSAAWLAGASLLFLAALGYWSTYPWPDRLWMWATYALDAPPNAIVHRWLVITGLLAALPLAAFPALAWRLRPARPALYGDSTWASRTQMDRSGIASAKEPF